MQLPAFRVPLALVCLHTSASHLRAVSLNCDLGVVRRQTPLVSEPSATHGWPADATLTLHWKDDDTMNAVCPSERHVQQVAEAAVSTGSRDYFCTALVDQCVVAAMTASELTC